MFESWFLTSLATFESANPSPPHLLSSSVKLKRIMLSTKGDPCCTLICSHTGLNSRSLDRPHYTRVSVYGCKFKLVFSTSWKFSLYITELFYGQSNKPFLKQRITDGLKFSLFLNGLPVNSCSHGCS